MKKITLFLILFITSYNIIISQNKIYLKDTEMGKQKVNKTDEEWKNILSNEEYRVLRQKGTEYPHTGKYNLHLKMGFIIVMAARPPFLIVIRNLKLIVVGQVLMKQLRAQ